jgi:fermentation-respiration switch protein FrsA (DUF1100 family)
MINYKKILLLGFWFFIIISQNQMLFAQQKTEELVILLKAKNFRKINKMMDETMAKELSAKKLKKTFTQTEKYLGKFKNVEFIKTEMIEGLHQEKSKMFFEKGIAILTIAINDQKQISGMFISSAGYTPPVYGRNLTTGKVRNPVVYNTLTLPGELMFPADCKQCPVVVLVHGSGPQDMDETIFGNKVFYDLALGLAANGIATFRYDKRFKTYPELQKTAFTIHDETINDAVAAVKLLQNDSSLPINNIFVLGHSLGGYAAPMISDSLSDIAGIILWAAPARRMEDIMAYQLSYFHQAGDLRKRQYKLFRKLQQKRISKIQKGDFQKGAKPMLAYWPGSFFESVAKYNPAISIKNQPNRPFLVLQGEKDFQVTMEDFQLFQKQLEGANHVTFKSYPELNHLFMNSTMEMPTTIEYLTPSNVNYEVINDIAVWIKNQSTNP